jgi:hypothetical protein
VTTELWILLGVLAAFAISGALAIRALVYKSREQEKKIDYTKIRRWSDDD